ncbi:hypothetical protein CRUP_016521, partial [Coryphaenoides rupestris]
YVCIIQKAYQDTDSVVSTVTTKVKGYAVINGSSHTHSRQFGDVADFVIPSQPSNICKNDDDCTTGLMDLRGNGRCVTYSDSIQTCEVISWCPLEDDTGLPERNIMPHINLSYLKRCEFHSTRDPDCPIFRLQQIASDAGEDFQDMAVKGGVLGIFIDWTCDLDLWAAECRPKYSFKRLDNNKNVIAPGYNFRFAKYYKTPGGEEWRTLIKAYGIRFEVIVMGTAGKFSIAPAIVNLGATLTFLSLLPTVSDWILLTCTKKKHFYSKHRTTNLKDVDDDDDENKLSMTMGTSYGTQ